MFHSLDHCIHLGLASTHNVASRSRTRSVIIMDFGDDYRHAYERAFDLDPALTSSLEDLMRSVDDRMRESVMMTKKFPAHALEQDDAYDDVVDAWSSSGGPSGPEGPEGPSGPAASSTTRVSFKTMGEAKAAKAVTAAKAASKESKKAAKATKAAKAARAMKTATATATATAAEDMETSKVAAVVAYKANALATPWQWARTCAARSHARHASLEMVIDTEEDARVVEADRDTDVRTLMKRQYEAAVRAELGEKRGFDVEAVDITFFRGTYGMRVVARVAVSVLERSKGCVDS